MADKKISQLSSASTPLAGTEVLPIVQSSTTVKVSVADLTAGRAISATQVTASTGNFIVGTAGKGIDFSANTHAAGMTSELLTWYEEGTFTPTVLGTSVFGTATYSYQVGKYTRIGNEVFFSASLAWTGHTGSGNIAGLYGLPFAAVNTANNYAPLSILVSDLPLTAGNILQAYVRWGTTECLFRQVPTGGGSVAVVPLPVSCGLLSVSGHYYVT